MLHGACHCTIKHVFDLVAGELFQPDDPSSSDGKKPKSYLTQADKFAFRATSRHRYKVKCTGYCRAEVDDWLWKELVKELNEELDEDDRDRYELTRGCLPGDCHYDDEYCGRTVKDILAEHEWMDEQQQLYNAGAF